jgi:hypothetical protein
MRDTLTSAAATRPFSPLLEIPIDVRALARSAAIPLTHLANLSSHLKLPNFETKFKKLGISAEGHTVPIIGEISLPAELYSALKPTYAPTDKIEDLPLYFVVYNPGHLSLVVLFNGTMYSLGLGYQESTRLEEKAGAAAGTVSKAVRGNIAAASAAADAAAGVVHETISMAALYNQDDVIIAGLDNVTRKGDPYRFPLASMGFFTKTHADKILEVAQRNIGVLALSFEDEMPIMQTLPLNFRYLKASNPLIIRATGGGAMNCTSFLEYVFSEKMSCVGSKGGFVFSHPLECKSYAPLLNPTAKTIEEREEDLNERFKQVILEFLTLTHYEEGTFEYLNFARTPGMLSKLTFGYLGGGGGRKTRKHRSAHKK